MSERGDFFGAVDGYLRRVAGYATAVEIIVRSRRASGGWYVYRTVADWASANRLLAQLRRHHAPGTTAAREVWVHESGSRP